jgi:uncharacterized protein (DUF302 family)
MNYGFSKTVSMPYEQVIDKVTTELQKEGFGVLTSIDVRDTFKKKIDVDFKKYVILGACNPNLAYKALQAEEELGLLLPCNILVYEKEQETVVSIFDPTIMTKIIDNDSLMPVAVEVKGRMEKVLKAV